MGKPDDIEILEPDDGRNPSWFKKGQVIEGRGRPPGSSNKVTRILKEALIVAACEEGRDGAGEGELVGFLRRLANEDIRSFAALLGRVIPLQVENKGDMRVEITYDTVDEVRRELEAQGINLEMVKKALHVPFDDPFADETED
jgi:hypothetical protein